MIALPLVHVRRVVRPFTLQAIAIAPSSMLVRNRIRSLNNYGMKAQPSHIATQFITQAI